MAELQIRMVYTTFAAVLSDKEVSDEIASFILQRKKLSNAYTL
jgi:hypothetical protein